MKVQILKRNEASENHIVTRNEIIQLQQEINLTNDQLHKICQLMKRKDYAQQTPDIPKF